MRRVFSIVALLVLVTAGLIWVTLWFSVSPAARTARPYARDFALQLQHDVRFTNIQVGFWESGSKGPIYVRGVVRSDADKTELRRKFDSLHCPVGVSWSIAVDTNRLDGVR